VSASFVKSLCLDEFVSAILAIPLRRDPVRESQTTYSAHPLHSYLIHKLPTRPQKPNNQTPQQRPTAILLRRPNALGNRMPLQCDRTHYLQATECPTFKSIRPQKPHNPPPFFLSATERETSPFSDRTLPLPTIQNNNPFGKCPPWYHKPYQTSIQNKQTPFIYHYNLNFIKIPTSSLPHIYTLYTLTELPHLHPVHTSNNSTVTSPAQ
jgi:hypothetical protein